jgi:hypothetical protein
MPGSVVLLSPGRVLGSRFCPKFVLTYSSHGCRVNMTSRAMTADVHQLANDLDLYLARF